MKKRTAVIRYSPVLAVAVIALLAVAVFMRTIGAHENDSHTRTELGFELWVELDEVYEMVMNYDPRLEPFAHEFFTQINEIIQGFYNALRYSDASYVRGYLSRNIVIVENAKFQNMNLIERVFSTIDWAGALDSHLYRVEQSEVLQSEEWLTSFSTFFVNVQERGLSGNQIEFNILFNVPGNINSPRLAALYLDDFLGIFFNFQTSMPAPWVENGTALYSHGVALGLENMRFRIFEIFTE